MKLFIPNFNGWNLIINESFIPQFIMDGWMDYLSMLLLALIACWYNRYYDTTGKPTCTCWLPCYGHTSASGYIYMKTSLYSVNFVFAIFSKSVTGSVNLLDNNGLEGFFCWLILTKRNFTCDPRNQLPTRLVHWDLLIKLQDYIRCILVDWCW